MRLKPASAILSSVFVAVIWALSLQLTAPAEAAKSASAPNVTPARAAASEAYGKLPLAFEVNQGQTDKLVKFLSRGHGYALFLTPTEAVFTLRAPAGKTGAGNTTQASLLPLSVKSAGQKPPSSKYSVLRIRLDRANDHPAINGIDQLAGKSNYFIGNNPKSWHANIPTYAKVKYSGVYPGVDLVYYGNQRQVEYDFVIAQGADPGVIGLTFKGAQRLGIDHDGNLVVQLADGKLLEHAPVIFQEIKGVRRPVAGRYVLRGDHTVGFKLAAYDRHRALTIDPSLVYSTYLGGSGGDSGLGIDVDRAGSAYVIGDTSSTNFPTTAHAPQTTFGGGLYDVFVSKLNRTGSALVYSTYLGGNDFDVAGGITVDSAGNAYVTGQTGSSNFPTTPGALQTILGGQSDAFVSKLNRTGSALVYSTYLGGSSGAVGYGIAVDPAGYAYVTGAAGLNFPTTAGALQTTIGGQGDAFVSKLNKAGSALDLFYLSGWQQW